MEILRFTARGLSAEEIAGRLYVQWRGVERRISAIAAKLNAEDPQEMVSIARDHGLLED